MGFYIFPQAENIQDKKKIHVKATRIKRNAAEQY
jgi:hypothetical protein